LGEGKVAVRLNPATLRFRVPGVLGGLLMAGARGPRRSTPGNGDCLLLDGERGLLGVADAAERSPQASRTFLEGIAQRLRAAEEGSRDDRFSGFLEAAHAVLHTFRYEERTTFICLLLAGPRSLYYICGGDSLLFHLDPDTGRVRFRNRANMGFAGRSRQIVDSGRLDFRPGDLVLMATDGVWDLTGGSSEELVRAFFTSLGQGPFEETPERLTRERHPAFREGPDRPCDDFGVILADPFRLGDLAGQVLAGGTGGAAEERYRLLRVRGGLPDRYLPLPDRGGAFWRFPEDFSRLDMAREGASPGV